MEGFFANNPLLIVLYGWSLVWKGLALWRSSKYEQRNWFIALLIINTFGILEILYLFRFAKKNLTLKEMRTWTPSNKSKG